VPSKKKLSIYFTIECFCLKTYKEISILFTCSIYSKNVQVISYNAGLTEKKFGMALVRDVKLRRIKQNEILFNSDDIISPNRPFVLMLQEVWTKKSFRKYKKNAQEKGYTIVPNDYREEVKNRGIITITNLSLLSYQFLQFQEDYPGNNRRGLLVANIKIGEKKVKFINTHTSYSDSKEVKKVQSQQFENIKNYVSQNRDQNIVLAGDFNAGADLDFKKSSYDVADNIWFSEATGIFGMIKKDLNLVSEGIGPTWDDDDNDLVYNATFLIKKANKALYGTAGWEETTSTLDHVFSNVGEVISNRVILNEDYIIEENRDSKVQNSTKKSKLSDHYGVEVILDF